MPKRKTVPAGSVPFIASHNYKGTDCLSCHHVPEGTVNGAASIVLDLTEEFDLIDSINAWLWIGQVMLQIVLFFLIDVLIRSFTDPLHRLQGGHVCHAGRRRFVPASGYQIAR